MFGIFGKKSLPHAADLRSSPNPKSSEDNFTELGMKVERISSRLEMGDEWLSLESIHPSFIVSVCAS